MGRLAFMSQKAETIAPKIEQLVRQEIGANAPLAYAVENGEAGTVTAGSLLGDLGAAFVGGTVNQLFRLNIQLPEPRPASLQASVERQGFGSYVGLLLYSTRLAKPLAGEVMLDEPDPRTLQSKFVGEPAACARLNQKELLRRVNWLARTVSPMGAMKISIKRTCRIVPHGGGSLLVVGTLPRPTWMGLAATADAKQFFEVAALIEAAL